MLQKKSSSFVYMIPKDPSLDPHGLNLCSTLKKHFDIHAAKILRAKLFEFYQHSLSQDEENFVKEALVDTVLYDFCVHHTYENPSYQTYIAVSKKPGITDDEGVSAAKIFEDRFGKSGLTIFTHDLYLFENKIDELSLDSLARSLLGNPLINIFSFSLQKIKAPFLIQQTTQSSLTSTSVPIPATDDGLMALSTERHLFLDLTEMKTIKQYFCKSDVQSKRQAVGLQEPSDCEWEILAQTWSEHCKHKEFNADILFTDLDTGDQRLVSSLFRSKIKLATEIIDQRFKAKNRSFLVKVFNDNAGVVKVDEQRLFVWKVETHNTPSALDPYCGAMTGILGVNRDAFGTGVGGARLLFNTNCLCFGPPDYSKPLQAGQWHPSYIREGVVAGIRDGGNMSGVPTVNGSVIYDDRYSGKPLVFCGTGALMPMSWGQAKSWEKPIAPGDFIVVVGGKVGKDGIHGATVSSSYTDASTPSTIVQLGSPMTQKFLSDFLEKATQLGLVKSCTDNGAGGLSSSVGELAALCGGAIVNLEKVPLKTTNLAPWEIFLSESQERMTLVCTLEHCQKLCELASDYEVSSAIIGQFTDSGMLDVRFDNKCIAYLDLDFLHDGVPTKKLEAEWAKSLMQEPQLPQFENLNSLLLDLLASDNICSRRSIIRQYDHEVKGRTVMKPLMGFEQRAPQDAAVMRLDFESYAGLIISNGIIPRYGDIDPYQMSAGSFDEGVRQIIAVGGRLPDPEDEQTPFWSVNDNFCLPNVVYHPRENPDGKLKLGKLVRMCDALFDMSTFFNIPMTSGKDSMKNDFGHGKSKISIPPTVLYSMVSYMPDVRRAVSSEFKRVGDLIYLVGETYNELGGSEFYKLFRYIGANVPVVRPSLAKQTYLKMQEAHSHNLLRSAHDLSDGGLLIALAESAIGSGKGASCQLTKIELTPTAFLFSESHSRFVVSIRSDEREPFEKIMGQACLLIGEVTESPYLTMKIGSKTYVHSHLTEMTQAWERDL